MSRLVPDRSPAGRAARLLRAGVAVVVTHSDFDAMPGGMSDAMADALGLTDVAGFAPVAAADQVKVVTFVPADVGAEHHRRRCPPPEPARSATTSECAFTVDGVGRFVGRSDDDAVVGQAGRRNAEPEVRVEMVAAGRTHATRSSKR